MITAQRQIPSSLRKQNGGFEGVAVSLVRGSCAAAALSGIVVRTIIASQYSDFGGATFALLLFPFIRYVSQD